MGVTNLERPAGLVNAHNGIDAHQDITIYELQLRPRALVVSGIRLYREALQQMLNKGGDVDVVGMSSIEDAAGQVRCLIPDVVVLDASGSSAAALARSLKALAPGLSVVVVTSAREEAEFLAWAEVGVSGYADQNSSAADLAAAVRHAARGEVLCSPRLAGLLAGRIAKLSAERHRGAELDALTPRERDVMALVAQGLSNKHIAKQLGISDTTAKNHVHNILDKLGLRSRGQAAAQYLCASPKP